MPVRSFDDACRLVIEYLSEVAPMGLWAVTRVTDGSQLVLASSGSTYSVHNGDAFRFSESLCNRMVSGEGPRTAPDVAHTPGDTDVAEAAPITIGTEMVVRADRAMHLSGATGSFGFAPYSVVTGFPGAWEAADQAMYEQKRRRRARVRA